MDNIDISFGDDVLLGHGNGVTIDDYNDNVISSETVVGPQGPPGPAGYSPTANVTQTEDGAIIRITDESGTTTANVYNGTDGVSPTATVTGTASGATITITDANGTTTATVNNGEDGDPGDNATISIGQVSTLTPGSQATVSNVGTPTNAVLNFGIPEGLQGEQGVQGNPGINAQAYVTQNTGSATITIEDADGTTTATVYDGTDGTNGTDGFSPVATVTPTASGATISITDAQGTTTANITNGIDGTNGTNGTNGTDGFSPIATVTQNTGSATISITDQNGTTTATVYDGTPGTVPNDGTLTIQKNGTTVQTFTANQSSNATANITVPTQFSDLSGTIGTSQIANTAITNAKIDWTDLFANSDVYHVGSSGTEQIVGKWNDGKNLYRTVVWIGLGENVESVVDMSSFNISEIVQFFEVMKTNDGSYFPAYYYANGDDWARWYYGGGDKKIHAISRWGSRGMILTLYYTKTS
jgi:hypothetical protein